MRQPVCALSGMRANPWCPTRIHEWLPAEDLGLPCSWHHQSDEGLLVVWPPPYRQWAQQQGLLGDEGIPRRVVLASGGKNPGERPPRGASASRSQRFEIANPPPGAIYLIDLTLAAPHAFTLTTPTVNLLAADWYRKRGIGTGGACIWLTASSGFPRPASIQPPRNRPHAR